MSSNASNNHGPLLITGASGHFGRKALETVLAAGIAPASIIATTRKPESLAEVARLGVQVRKADFDDAASLVAAFKGAKRALLISTDALDRPGRRLEQHTRAIAALAEAGVEHVVYTSLTNPHAGSPISIAPDHRLTEAALAASKLGWTVLRNNLYSDLFLAALGGAIASGKLVDARGDGAVGFVTRDDTARTAAAALIGDYPNERRANLEVTGPELLTSAQVAAIVSEIVGRPIVHVSVPVEALVQGLVGHGLPEPVAQLLASFDTAIARGELAIVSGTVATLTGRAPESLASFLRANLKA